MWGLHIFCLFFKHGDDNISLWQYSKNLPFINLFSLFFFRFYLHCFRDILANAMQWRKFLWAANRKNTDTMYISSGLLDHVLRLKTPDVSAASLPYGQYMARTHLEGLLWPAISRVQGSPLNVTWKRNIEILKQSIHIGRGIITHYIKMLVQKEESN